MRAQDRLLPARAPSSASISASDMSSWKRVPSRGRAGPCPRSGRRSRGPGRRTRPSRSRTTMKSAWSMRPRRSSWRADDPGEVAEVGRGRVRAEAVAVDAACGRPSENVERRRRPRASSETSQKSYSQPLRWSTTVRCASEPPAGRARSGMRTRMPSTSQRAPGSRAVHREDRVVGGRTSRWGAGSRRRSRPRRPAGPTGRPQPSGAPRSRSSCRGSRGSRGSTWLKGESSA